MLRIVQGALAVWFAGHLLSCSLLFSEVTSGADGGASPDAIDASAALQDAGGNAISPTILYRFERDDVDDTLVRDVAGRGAPHDLHIEDLGTVQWSAPRGLRLVEPTSITSLVSPGKLVTDCKESDALSIELWVKPANLSQNSPARIVSLAKDAISVPSFLVGQGTPATDGEHFEVRLNHSTIPPSLDSYGERAATSVGSLVTEWTHFVFTRSSERTFAAYINGEPTPLEALDAQGLPTIEEPGYAGNFDGWDEMHYLSIGNEVTANRPWLGELYLVALYCEGLTGEEVAQRYVTEGPS